MTLTPLNTTTPNLTTVDILFRIRERQQQIAMLQQLNDSDKITLEVLYTEGSISGKISTANISATRSTRTSYTYSSAVRVLKEAEVYDGIATPKETVTWTIRSAKA